MTESFSANSFVSLGTNSDWSKTFPTSNNQPQQQSKNISNPWSTTWDAQPNVKSSQSFAAAGGFKTNWDTPVKPQQVKPAPIAQQQPQPQAQTTPQQQNNNLWSTTWDVAIDPSKFAPLKAAVAAQVQKPLVVVQQQPQQAPQPTQQQQQQTPFSSPVKEKPTAVVAPQSTQQQQNQQNQQNQQQPQHEVTKQTLYKTEVCRSWIEKGVCKYGHKCQFAHGDDELRIVVRHPKYKTELCKTFVATGSCPYGNRCRFIHPPTVGESNNIQAQQQQVFSPSSTSSGSTTPPQQQETSGNNTSAASSSPLDVGQLLQALPSLSNSGNHELISEDEEDLDHRLSFFKHLTDE